MHSSLCLLQLHHTVNEHLPVHGIRPHPDINARQCLIRHGLQIPGPGVDIRQTGRQADGLAERHQLVPLCILLIHRQHNQYAIGNHLAVEVMVLLRGGQHRKAVVHGVGHAGGVIHLNKIGDKAGGNDDGLNDLRQFRRDAVGLAVRHGLLAPADDRLGAHGAQGNAHCIGMGGHIVPAGNGALIVLGHSVAHTGPEIAHRGIGDDLRVDEDMVGGNFREGVFPQAEYRELYKGHEVACHTVSHPTIGRCPLELVAQEVIEDRKKLESIMGYPVRGLAYPNGSESPEIRAMLPALGIRYGRVVGNTDGFAMPEDFLQWKATCHHNHNLLELGQQFVDLHKKQYLYMMYVWGHSYEFTNNNNWEVMEDFCKLVGGKDDIWYATNIQIVDYMDVVKAAQYAADGSFVYNPCAQSLWLCVDDEKFVEVKGGQQVQL